MPGGIHVVWHGCCKKYSQFEKNYDTSSVTKTLEDQINAVYRGEMTIYSRKSAPRCLWWDNLSNVVGIIFPATVVLFGFEVF